MGDIVRQHKYRVWDKCTKELFDGEDFIIFCGEIFDDYRDFEDYTPNKNIILM